MGRNDGGRMRDPGAIAVRVALIDQRPARATHGRRAHVRRARGEPAEAVITAVDPLSGKAVVEARPGLQSAQIIGIMDVASVRRAEAAALRHELRRHPVERVIGEGEDRFVALLEKGAIAVEVIFVALVVERIDLAGRRLGREGPARLALESIIAQLGLVAVGVNDGQWPVARIVGVGGIDLGDVGPYAFLDLGDAVAIVVAGAGNPVGPRRARGPRRAAGDGWRAKARLVHPERAARQPVMGVIFELREEFDDPAREPALLDLAAERIVAELDNASDREAGPGRGRYRLALPGGEPAGFDPYQESLGAVGEAFGRIGDRADRVVGADHPHQPAGNVVAIAGGEGGGQGLGGGGILAVRGRQDEDDGDRGRLGEEAAHGHCEAPVPRGVVSLILLPKRS